LPACFSSLASNLSNKVSASAVDPAKPAITFLLSMAMMIPFIEAQSKTCIVNAYFGIKNMGSSYEREQDDYSSS